MPEISLFYGIRVTMYYEDHNPPHFHAEYNGNKAIVLLLWCFIPFYSKIIILSSLQTGI